MRSSPVTCHPKKRRTRWRTTRRALRPVLRCLHVTDRRIFFVLLLQKKHTVIEFPQGPQFDKVNVSSVFDLMEMETRHIERKFRALSTAERVEFRPEHVRRGKIIGKWRCCIMAKPSSGMPHCSRC